MNAVKVYLDDERIPPPDWTQVRTGRDAIVMLETGAVDSISLDHDWGDGAGTGYDVILWIEEAVATRNFIAPEIIVHTANPSARQKMLAGVRSICRLQRALSANARRRQNMGNIATAVAHARPRHRLFQAAVALLANAYAGVDVRKDDFKPRPVFKHEGGVMVRNSEVVLYLNNRGIAARAVREPRESVDTAAAVQAACDLLTLVDWELPAESILERIALVVCQKTGMARESFDNKVERFLENPFGDPMRMLFDLE